MLNVKILQIKLKCVGLQCCGLLCLYSVSSAQLGVLTNTILNYFPLISSAAPPGRVLVQTAML